MALFKLLHGKHQHQGHIWDAMDPENNIVESEIDLEGRFGRDKFQRLDDNAPIPKKSRNDGDDTLASITDDELRAFAESEEIMLRDNMTREQILAEIRKARKD